MKKLYCTTAIIALTFIPQFSSTMLSWQQITSILEVSSNDSDHESESTPYSTSPKKHPHIQQKSSGTSSPKTPQSVESNFYGKVSPKSDISDPHADPRHSRDPLLQPLIFNDLETGQKISSRAHSQSKPYKNNQCITTTVSLSCCGLLFAGALAGTIYYLELPK